MMHLYQMNDNSLIIAETAGQGECPLRVKLGITAIVRYWGTTRGRGQLAIDGPTEKTTCDIEPAGGELNWLHIQRRIVLTDKAEKAWLNYLKENSGKK